MTKQNAPKPAHSEEFLRKAREHGGRGDDANAFIPDPGSGRVRVKDSLAAGIAGSFLVSATSGEEAGEEMANTEVPEEAGGPFVETTGRQEFARGTDLSNPKDAERAPFPTPNRAP